MTKNQVDALKYQESKRANRAAEELSAEKNRISEESVAVERQKDWTARRKAGQEYLINSLEQDRKRERDSWEKGIGIANAVSTGLKNIGSIIAALFA